jgi:hypothetical protein
MRKTLLIALAGALMSMALPGAAHHSGSMFDDKKVVTLKGAVKEFQYTNPHSWLIVDITNDDGSVTTWGFEAEGPSTLLRAGIKKSDFSPGTKITITAHPLRDGRPAGYWINAVREEDGKEFVPSAGFKVE